MKFFWALFLCGVTCCLAHPSCSNDELVKCVGKADISAMENEEDLNESCRIVDCVVGYYDRCEGHEPRNMYKVLLYKAKSTLCDKTNPLRRKFLENVKCLNRVMKDVFPKCAPGVREMDHESRCRELTASFQCQKEYVTSTCNKESAEVFSQFYPMLNLWVSGCYDSSA